METKKWTVDKVVKFRQPKARFGQEVQITVEIKEEFLAEFTGELYGKLSVASPERQLEYGTLYSCWGRTSASGSRCAVLKTTAGEKARKLKEDIRDHIAYAIGYLDALQIDEGEGGEEEQNLP